MEIRFLFERDAPRKGFAVIRTSYKSRISLVVVCIFLFCFVEGESEKLFSIIVCLVGFLCMVMCDSSLVNVI